MAEGKGGDYGVRIESALVKRIDKVSDRYHAVKFIPGFSVGLPPVLSRAQVIRWALQEGLDKIETALEKAEAAKKGGR